MIFNKANTDRSYIVEEGGDGQFQNEELEDEDTKNGPKKKILLVHDSSRLILFRHFTEATIRASYLKYNYDTSRLIENTENMFKK